MGCNGGGARNTRIYRRVLRVLQFYVGGEGRTVGRERRLLLLARKSPVVSAVAQPPPPSFCPRFPPSVINVVPSPRIPPFPHTPDRRRISRISSRLSSRGKFSNSALLSTVCAPLSVIVLSDFSRGTSSPILLSCANRKSGIKGERIATV